MRKASSTARRPDDGESPTGGGYWTSARRPLHILAYLLPLIVIYEVCLARMLSLDVEAHRKLHEFFVNLGVATAGGLSLGGLAIVVVLLVWHVLTRERWRVEPAVVAMMAVESLLLAAPLVVVGHLLTYSPLAAATGSAGSAAALPPPVFADLDIWSKVAISIGAGLYEEFFFRMLLIAVLHTLLVDVGKASPRLGAGIAIVVSAVAFAWYHDLGGPQGELSGRKMLFYLLAGVYFGLVYVLRGFGLAVGVHALYDIITVLIPIPDDG